MIPFIDVPEGWAPPAAPQGWQFVWLDHAAWDLLCACTADDLPDTRSRYRRPDGSVCIAIDDEVAHAARQHAPDADDLGQAIGRALADRVRGGHA